MVYVWFIGFIGLIGYEMLKVYVIRGMVLGFRVGYRKKYDAAKAHELSTTGAKPQVPKPGALHESCTVALWLESSTVSASASTAARALKKSHGVEHTHALA